MIVNEQISSVFDSINCLQQVRILFADNNLSKCQWIFTKLGVCIDIVEICFGIADGQILSILTELSAHDTSVFSFLDDNFSKHQWIFTKFGMCIHIVDICFGIAKFLPFLTELSACNTSIFYFQDNNLSKSQWIFTKFDMCIDIVKICFGIAHWQILSIFDRVICLGHDNGGVLSFHVLLMSKHRFSTKMSYMCFFIQEYGPW